jgi:hypothetical protein
VQSKKHCSFPDAAMHSPEHAAASSKEEQQAEKKKNEKRNLFQPQVPLRLPCYDLIPVINQTLIINKNKK